MKHLILILLCAITSVNSCEDKEVYPDKMYPKVLMTTTMGDILIELDRNRAPITVNNFLKYVKAGLYINTIFHRVEENFVIQGGGYDASLNEINGCGHIFNESGNGLKNRMGSIAMARYDDPHSATSQFFFNLTDSQSLDPNPKNWGYTVFGEVVEGMDVLNAIAKVNVGYSDKMQSANVPTESIIIKSIIVN